MPSPAECLQSDDPLSRRVAEGGYLVFGIDDEKKSIVGISNAVADVI